MLDKAKINHTENIHYYCNTESKYTHKSNDVFTAMHTSRSFIGENMPEDCDDFEDIKSKLMMLYL